MNKGIKEITITIDDDGKEITLSYEEWKTIFYALKPVIEPVIVKDYTPIFPNYPPKNDFYGPGLVPAPWEMPTPIWCGDGLLMETATVVFTPKRKFYGGGKIFR